MVAAKQRREDMPPPACTAQYASPAVASTPAKSRAAFETGTSRCIRAYVAAAIRCVLRARQ